jgi:long-chain acyl-CoA synthetase
MLSHLNLACNAAATADAFDTDENQLRLNILPLSHIYARTCDLYMWVYVGCQLVLAENRETLGRDCQLVRPTMLNAVPYVYQKIADRIRAASDDEAQEANNLRAFFGGQIETLFSGGAPLAPDVGQWFADHGLPIMAGYGLTESSPVITVSTPAAHQSGAVGLPLANVEVRIADDGEILTLGPHVMLGYWQDEEATANTIRDGWLHTGDLGYLDPNNFLFIRGRKKELIVLSTGKKAHPSRVESLLTASPLIEQAAVFGEGRSFLVALIVPAVACHAAPQSTSSGGLAENSSIADEIARCLQHASHEEQVRQFAILDRPFSQERGELTPKLSLRRKTIAENFSQQIADLYANTSTGEIHAGTTSTKQTTDA